MGESLVALAVWPLPIRTVAGESPVSLTWVVVPVERIELPTFGLQNLLPVNKDCVRSSEKAKFVDSIGG